METETDGMIVDILDQIPDEAVMYLINALSFDAEWQNIYTTKTASEKTSSLLMTAPSRERI